MRRLQARRGETPSTHAAGPGLRVEPDGRGGWCVAAVLPDGPAESAGLAPGDAVAAVDFRSLEVLPDSGCPRGPANVATAVV
jgi:C-terminal processing protease CtpA/Prc